jgi:hypothetical protein
VGVSMGIGAGLGAGVGRERVTNATISAVRGPWGVVMGTSPFTLSSGALFATEKITPTMTKTITTPKRSLAPTLTFFDIVFSSFQEMNVFFGKSDYIKNTFSKKEKV